MDSNFGNSSSRLLTRNRSPKTAPSRLQPDPPLCNLIPVGLFRTTLRGEVLQANNVLAAMLGYDNPEELRRSNARRLYVNPGRRRELVSTLKADGQVRCFEAEFKTKQGKVLTGFLAASLHNGIVEGVIMDGSAHRHQEREGLQVACRQWCELIATAAGDLKAPATSIEIASQLLARRSRPPRPRLLRALSGQAEHLVALVNDLLDLSLLELNRCELRPRRLDLTALLSACGERVRRQLGCRLNVLGQTGLSVETDAARLEQALAVLLESAAHSSPRGHLITLRACRRAGTARVEVRFQAQPAAAPAWDIPERVPPDGHGWRLYVARRIIEQHGGRLWAEGLPGQGAAFHLRLPLAADPQEGVPTG